MSPIICYAVLFFGVVLLANGDNVERKFEDAGIPNDLNISAPKKSQQIKYGDHEVKIGETLTKDQTTSQPNLKLEGAGDALQTVVLIDPDAPSKSDPTRRSWLHWLVVNVRDNNVDSGKTVVSYNGPSPPKGSGPHRYIILTFSQNREINVSPAPERASFNIANFISQNSLTGPKTGNFYLVEQK